MRLCLSDALQHGAQILVAESLDAESSVSLGDTLIPSGGEDESCGRVSVADAKVEWRNAGASRV